MILFTRRALLAVGVVAAAGLAGCGGSSTNLPSTGATGPAPNASELTGRIVYLQQASSTDQDTTAKRSDVYIVNADGTGVLRLTPANLGLVNADASLSPDGTRVTFSSSDADNRSTIYVVNADGSGLKRLTDASSNDSSPVWATDGKSVIYSSPGANLQSEATTMQISADGSGTPQDAYYRSVPRFSADGTRRVYEARATPTAVDEFYVSSSYFASRSATQATASGTVKYSPSLSPKGDRVAYIDSGKGNPSDFKIYVVNSDGTNRRLIPTVAGKKFVVSFSPDGQYLTYAVGGERLTSIVNISPGNIYITRADGSSQSRALMPTSGSVNQYAPSWGR